MTRPLAVAALLTLLAGPGQAQDVALSSVAAFGPEAGSLVAELTARGELGGARSFEDHDFPGRRYLRREQRIAGVPVYGAELVQAVDERGATVSVFGRLAGPAVAPAVPVLDAERATAIARDRTGGDVAVAGRLVWLPLGVPRLCFTVLLRTAESLPRVFVDAADGRLVASWDELQTESALGRGTWRDVKKLSVERSGGRFLAHDLQRPADVATWDLRDSLGLAARYRVLTPPPRDDIAAHTGGDWDDGAVVDAHAYAGFTYDYLFLRHGRRGADDADGPLRMFVHYRQTAAGTYANAFFDPSTNGFYFGDGDGQTVAFSAGLDVVAHEITHALTGATWNGVYANESGALNEAFSDIVGASVEFFRQPPGEGRLRSDWELGEDLGRSFAAGPVRSMSDPGSICTRLGCHPDHVSKRYRGSEDSGGVHVNSGIVNHAFYLFVQGGTNRTSGLHVDGLGVAARERAERIFMRGFTSYLTPFATFGDARAATLQAARDLYGDGNEVLQLAAAWTAVGVD